MSQELLNEVATLLKGYESKIETLVKTINDFKEVKEPNENKEFLTRKETAEYFSVSLVCLHGWVKKKIIKPYKVGNRTYFKHSELVNVLLNSNKVA